MQISDVRIESPHPRFNELRMNHLPRRTFLSGSAASVAVPASSLPTFASSGHSAKHWEPTHAKAVIFVVLEGGPSHIDTFDPKPELLKWHRRTSSPSVSERRSERVFVASPFRFRKAGKSGIDLCEKFIHLGADPVADQICVYRGCQTTSLSHSVASLILNKTSTSPVAPSLGARIANAKSAAFGTEVRAQGAFYVLTDSPVPLGGSTNWSHALLPNHCQAIITPAHTLSASRFCDESQRTLTSYGIEHTATSVFAKQCLRARQLVEKGTKFVQIHSSGWDSHECLLQNHASRIQSVDQPLAALIIDLKQRGMLSETVVVCLGEFGRSPDTDRLSAAHLGREHNANAMSILFAGGGFRAGATVGATDELGGSAVDCVGSIADVHATILHQMGNQNLSANDAGSIIRELVV